MSLDQIMKTTELQRLADLSIRSLRQSPHKATLGLSPTKTRNFLLLQLIWSAVDSTMSSARIQRNLSVTPINGNAKSQF